jgi:hypothetical protein
VRLLGTYYHTVYLNAARSAFDLSWTGRPPERPAFD